MTEAVDWRSTTYVAPSWSWASCKKYYPITYPLSSTAQSTIRILDASVTTSGANPLGSVTDGFLKVEGSVRRATVEPSDQDRSSIFQVNFAATGTRDKKPIGRVVLAQKSGILPTVWCLQLCVRTSPSFALPVKVYGILILEEVAEGGFFRRLSYVYRDLTEADWEPGEIRNVVLK